MCIYVLDEWNDMLASSDRWSSSTSSPFHSFIIPEQIIQFNNKEFKEDEHWAAWEPVQAFQEVYDKANLQAQEQSAHVKSWHPSLFSSSSSSSSSSLDSWLSSDSPILQSELIHNQIHEFHNQPFKRRSYDQHEHNDHPDLNKINTELAHVDQVFDEFFQVHDKNKWRSFNLLSYTSGWEPINPVFHSTANSLSSSTSHSPSSPITHSSSHDWWVDQTYTNVDDNTPEAEDIIESIESLLDQSDNESEHQESSGSEGSEISADSGSTVLTEPFDGPAEPPTESSTSTEGSENSEEEVKIIIYIYIILYSLLSLYTLSLSFLLDIYMCFHAVLDHILY